MLAGAKKLALFTAGAASQKYMNALADQQEVMADLADIIIQVYALESALLRARKLKDRSLPLADTAVAMVQLYAAKAMDIVELASRRIIAAVDPSAPPRRIRRGLRRARFMTIRRE